MNKKLTSSLFTSLVTLLFFTIQIFFFDLSMSSFLLRFVEDIMRSQHWSNQHKHFNKSNIMNLPLFSTTIEIYLTFYDRNNYKNGKYNSCAASIFNEAHIFRREYSFLIYKEKRQEEKIEFEQSSWLHKIQLIKVMCLIDNSKY